MATPLPVNIAKARTLIVEAMKIVGLHGKLRVRRVETMRGTEFVITVVIPWPEAGSDRARKQEARRMRG